MHAPSATVDVAVQQVRMHPSATIDVEAQVLVVGGSSVDCANGGTAASTYSYLINVAAGANHAPVQETMPAARVVR